MARGKRKNPTDSLGIRPQKTVTISNRPMREINTVHAFGPQGNETSGWPYRARGIPGVPIGGPFVYRPPRLSQNELGGSGPRSRSHKRRKHPTESLGA